MQNQPLTDARLALRDWLEREARLMQDRTALVAELGRRLIAAGVPVARITTAVPVLHPILDTSSVLWEPGEAPVERLWQMQPENYHMLANSPLKICYDGGGPVRCRIGPQPEAGEFTILPDLRAAGMRDYVALPAPFSDGTTKAMTFASKATDGFSDDNIALLSALMPSLAMILEIQTLRRTTRTFLETYVGEGAGQRVLDGTVKRGMGEIIPCAILFCDLRGFTHLSNSLDIDGLLALLNDYFDVVTEAVRDHGGEVLKFIGDAVLAVFAHEAGTSDAVSAAQALAASLAAQARLQGLNKERAAVGRRNIRAGMALHVGEVLYGNIGGRKRLDFTVIGPAVNLASRIEKLCGELDKAVLMSAAFAALIDAPCREMGAYAFKGVGEKQSVFAPA